MNISILKTNNPALDAGNILNKYLAASEPILLLVSGGSAFDILSYINTDLMSEHVTISVLDERFSHDPLINNFHQLSDTIFFKKSVKKGASFIRTVPRNNESIHNLAQRYEQALKNWRTECPRGKIIATIGIGIDGHTSGIMPYPEDGILFLKMFQSKNLVCGYDAGDKNKFPLRVTTTCTFLTQWIDYAVMYIKGDDKKNMLKKVLSDTGNVHVVPARIIHTMKKVDVITDIQI